MRYYDGDEIYLPPVRYWEDPTPERCRILGAQGGDGLKHLYVHHQGFGHAVYVELPVFYSRQAALDYAELQRQIHCLIQHDEASVIAERILANPQKPWVQFLIETWEEPDEEGEEKESRMED